MIAGPVPLAIAYLPGVRNVALFAAGLVLGAANTARHRRQGYTSPRPFGAEDLDRAIDHAFGIADGLERDGHLDWRGRRVLELGPGADLGPGAIMVARGAASYEAVDLFDNRFQTPPALYERLGQRLGTSVDLKQLVFTQTSFPTLPDISGPYDLIVSNACLEHVADISNLFRRLHEVAGPGACMVHRIDGRAHMKWFRDHDPLNILRYPEPLYRRLLSFPGAPNRLRAHDYQRMANEAGWRNVSVSVGETAPQEYLSRFRAAAEFRDADLHALTFTVVAHA